MACNRVFRSGRRLRADRIILGTPAIAAARPAMMLVLSCQACTIWGLSRVNWNNRFSTLNRMFSGRCFRYFFQGPTASLKAFLISGLT